MQAPHKNWGEPMKLGLGSGFVLALVLGMFPLSARGIILPPSFGGYVRYTMTNGVVRSGGIAIGELPPDIPPGSRGTVGVEAFSQSGGTRIVDGLLVMNGYSCYSFCYGSYNALYDLSGGQLTSRGIQMAIAAFTQTGGTNKVQGDLILFPGWYGDMISYKLTGGRLITSNTVIYVGTQYLSPVFRQNGGVCIIRELLDLRGEYSRGVAAAFQLSGGKLIAQDIALSGSAIFSHRGGTIVHSGSLTLADGHWNASAGSHRLGRLQLNHGNTNSSIRMPMGLSATLRFEPSEATSWHPDGRLVIYNWTGSINGRGAHQIYFGTNRAGISAQQLSQIRFRNPAVFAPGDYPARIRGNGEIVPIARPSLRFARTETSIVMQWSGDYVLQTATNVLGPFTDVIATSPYEVKAGSELARFFRLRQ